MVDTVPVHPDLMLSLQSPETNQSISRALPRETEMIEVALTDPEGLIYSVETVEGFDASGQVGTVVEESPSWILDEFSYETETASACDGHCETGCSSCCGSGKPVASHWSPWQGWDLFAKVNLDALKIGKRFRQQRRRDRGIGYERVMFAPNVLDTAIASPHVGFRFQLDSGLKTPDRAEYFWGTNPAGPGADSQVNVQDLSVRLAMGNDKAMALTQYTLRSLDPDQSGNTTGMGDMLLGAQALLVDGKRTKLATIFRTYLATGPADRGLGTGHASIEPGLLARYCHSPETYFFGELKYWLPIGGNADVSGDVLSTGWGISTIASESDVYALMPTLELRTLTFLFGGQTETSGGSVKRIDGLTAVELYPGARLVLGPETDLGLWEFGIGAGVTIADDQWFDSRMVFDIRLSR